METPARASNLLLVDDDETTRRLLEMAAREQGWTPLTASCGQSALEVAHPGIEAVVLDHSMPGMNGLETLVRLRERFPNLPVVMLTGLNEAETAVKALRAGAVDYITKPFELKRLFELLREARQNTRREAAKFAALHSSKRSGHRLTSASPPIRDLYRRLEKAAALDATILLTGESGTGKTYFAKEIHRMSPRAAGPFITVSCPALPRELLESELFGHERGAFTGATSLRTGRFEQATVGTLFLDEIGDLPSDLQPKLLNVLQDREFFRVGGSSVLRTEARVIAATNVDLRAKIESGDFREDLYYRLNIIELPIPPLRERLEDLPALAEALLGQIAEKRKTNGWRIAPAGLKVLLGYSWPGNIRQLENVLERATAFAEGEELEASDFAALLTSPRGVASTKPATLQAIEREAFIAAFLRNNRNKARTARELGISERSVYNLIDRHGLK